MGYLYGDATPFPLDENFIDTLSKLTETCVALYRAHNGAVGRHDRLRHAQAQIEDEENRLRELGATLATALSTYSQGLPHEAATKSAKHILEAAQAFLTREADELQGNRAKAMREATSTDVGRQIREAVEQFFVRHQLPETTWGATWRQDPLTEEPEGVVIAFAPRHIRVDFTAFLEPDSLWAKPIRVSDLESDLTITLSKEPGLLGKNTRKESLHKLLVTEVNYTPNQFSYVLKSSPKRSTAGYRFVIADGSHTVPFVQRLSGDGLVEGKSERLSGEDAARVHLLWNDLDKRVGDLIRMRRSVSSVRHGARETKEAERPALIAETMLAIVAPLVLEMRKRSRVKGEMALKRELGDGRREELFVPREELSKKFAELPDEQRRVFEAIGLSAEPTSEFVASMLTYTDDDLDDVVSSARLVNTESQTREIEAGDPDDDFAA